MEYYAKTKINFACIAQNSFTYYANNYITFSFIAQIKTAFFPETRMVYSRLRKKPCAMNRRRTPFIGISLLNSLIYVTFSMKKLPISNGFFAQDFFLQ